MYRGAVGGRYDELPYRESDLDEYMGVAHAAVNLGLSQTAVYNLVRMRKLTAVRTPIGLLVSRSAVVAERKRRDTLAELKRAAQRGDDNE